MSQNRPYDSRQIANRFIELAGRRRRSISIMHVLKLAYMAHGWTLATRDHALVNDHVQAWRYGPVIPSIYYSFRPFGAFGIRPVELVHEEKMDSGIESLLGKVHAMYQHLSGRQLSALTHIAGGPWDRIYKKGVMGLIIPNDLIKSHFEDKLQRASNG